MKWSYETISAMKWIIERMNNFYFYSDEMKLQWYIWHKFFFTPHQTVSVKENHWQQYFFPPPISAKKKKISPNNLIVTIKLFFFFFSPFLHFGNETVIIKLFFSFSLYFGNDIPTIQFYFSLSSLPLFGNDIIIIQLFFLSPYFGQINFGQVSLTAQKLGRYFSKILPKSLFLSIPVRHTISLSSLLHFLTISIYHCWNSPLFSLHISQINLNLHNI